MTLFDFEVPTYPVTPLIATARDLAIRAHGEQRRMTTAEPYWHHPREVAEIVYRLVPNDEEIIAAAWLHDVLEDTQVTLQEVSRLTGAVVAQLVVQVTQVSSPINGLRSARKHLDHCHYANGEARAQTIKLADAHSNVMSFAAYRNNKTWLKLYLKEKLAMARMLSRGHPAYRKELILRFERMLEELQETPSMFKALQETPIK